MKKYLSFILLIIFMFISGCTSEKLILTKDNILVKCPQINDLVNSLYYFDHTQKEPYTAPLWFNAYETDTFYNEKEFLSNLEIDLYLPENILKNLGADYYQKILYRIDETTELRTDQQIGIEMGGSIGNRNGLRTWSYTHSRNDLFVSVLDPSLYKIEDIHVSFLILTVYFRQRIVNYEYGEAINLILYSNFYINEFLYTFCFEYDFLK